MVDPGLPRGVNSLIWTSNADSVVGTGPKRNELKQALPAARGRNRGLRGIISRTTNRDHDIAYARRSSDRRLLRTRRHHDRRIAVQSNRNISRQMG